MLAVKLTRFGWNFNQRWALLLCLKWPMVRFRKVPRTDEKQNRAPANVHGNRRNVFWGFTVMLANDEVPV